MISLTKEEIAMHEVMEVFGFEAIKKIQYKYETGHYIGSISEETITIYPTGKVVSRRKNISGLINPDDDGNKREVYNSLTTKDYIDLCKRIDKLVKGPYQPMVVLDAAQGNVTLYFENGNVFKYDMYYGTGDSCISGVIENFLSKKGILFELDDEE